MSTSATPYPLAWPPRRPRRPAHARKFGRFNTKETRPGEAWARTSEVSVAEALDRLQAELDRIGARLPVVSSNVETRLDGRPRSGQRDPEDPGVAVYFQLAGKPVCMPCDTYKTVAHNIAAIAAHIEATRKIERHGVATVAEMFSGFVALPPSHKPWWEVLGVTRGAERSVIEGAYRTHVRAKHPDRGGSHAAMADLNRARAEALTERK